MILVPVFRNGDDPDPLPELRPLDSKSPLANINNNYPRAPMNNSTKQTIQNIHQWAMQNGRNNNDLTTLLTALLSGEIEGDFNKSLLCSLLEEKKSRSASGIHFSSPTVIPFICRAIKGRKIESVLDPACGSGLLLKEVSEATDAPSSIGFEINPEVAQIAQNLTHGRSQIIHGNFFDLKQDHDRLFDLIVCDLPISYRLNDRESATLSETTIARTSDEAMMYWACEHLSDQGLAWFMAAPRFEIHRQFHNQINALGCRINTMIRIPRGHRFDTQISLSLIGIEKGEQNQIFVAKFHEDHTTQQHILNNMATPGQKGPQPALGDWCNIADYRGFEAHESQHHLNKRIQRSNFKPHHANAVFTQIERVRNTQETIRSFDEDAGDLLLLPNNRVLTQTSDFPKRMSMGIHLKLNRELVHPHYFSHWMKSEPGQLFLRSVSHGTAMTMPNLRIIRETDLLLPDLKEQTLVSNTMRRCEMLHAEITEIQRNCFDGEFTAQDLAEKAATLNHEESDEQWLETLPYPLATILWRHRTCTESTDKRMKTLLHFFEALASFMATIHLSAYSTQPETWDSVQEKMLKSLNKANLSLERPTFGSWKCVCEVLSNHARTNLRKPDKKAAVHEMYCTKNTDFLNQTLLSTRIIEIIGKANSLRNRHQGHSGAKSEAQEAQVEQELLGLLAEVRKNFGSSWRQYELVRPDQTRYRNGEHHYKLPILMGTRNPFPNEKRTTLVPMESDTLHMLGRDASEGLKLLPLIRMARTPSSERNACYFLNRIERDKPVFVSYHHESELDPSEDLGDTIQALHTITHTHDHPITKNDI